MKAINLTIAAMLIFSAAHSQKIAGEDSTVIALKAYMQQQTRPSAELVESHIQGRAIVAFTIDTNKKITGIHFLKPLKKQYDNEIVRVLMAYPKSIELPAAEYSIGVEFLVSRTRTFKSVPFDKSIYHNFLFDIDISAVPLD